MHLSRLLSSFALLLAFGSYSVTASARYVESDPVGLKGGSNSTYTYVNENPLTYYDPLGLAPGDPFATPDDAARDAGNWARMQPKQFLENGGYIYKDRNCWTYNAIPYHDRMPDKVPSAKVPLPPVKPYGGWHTHPGWHSLPDFAYNENDENFSMGASEDYGWAQQNGPLYLNTPMGVNKVLNPDGTQRVLSNKKPKSCTCTQ